MVAIPYYTYSPTSYPVDEVRKLTQIDIQNYSTHFKDEEIAFEKNEDITKILDVEKHKPEENQDQTQAVKLNINLDNTSSLPIKDISPTIAFQQINLNRKLSEVKILLNKMVLTSDKLDRPLLFSQIREILQQLIQDISQTEPYLRIQLIYLEQAIVSNSWDHLSEGKIKSLISLIDNINNKSEWNNKSLKAFTNQLFSSNFQLIKPIEYVETEDTEISS